MNAGTDAMGDAGVFGFDEVAAAQRAAAGAGRRLLEVFEEGSGLGPQAFQRRLAQILGAREGGHAAGIERRHRPQRRDRVEIVAVDDQATVGIEKRQRVPGAAGRAEHHGVLPGVADPEAAAGPHDANYLFDRFRDLVVATLKDKNA